MTPTFFLVGAPKAGTTSLFRYLSAHPEIGVSLVKEPCFFAPEVPVDERTDALRRNWDTYLTLFAGTAGRRAVGEGTVAYLGSLNAAAAISAKLPGARILMMLRDPADRLFAHYAALRAAEPKDTSPIATFSAWVDQELERERHREPIYGAVWAGRYATHLTRFRAHFAESQIQISYYEDFIADPKATLARVFAFLGVDPAVHIDHSARHNVTTTPRWPGLSTLRQPIGATLRQMLPAGAYARAREWSRRRLDLTPTAADRAIGIALYRQEIELLSQLTGRNLSLWLTP